MKLRINVLVENTASSGFYGEHGLSYLLEYDDRVLLDTGQSELFLHNAKKMNINLDDVHNVVLSHGHYDHGNGLVFLENKKLICHPNVFAKRYSGKQMKYVGINQAKADLQKKLTLKFSKDSVWLSKNMVFLGEIPRIVPFEKNISGFFLEDKQIDSLLDDTAIAITMPQGLFIITGCSHSGICNIITHAQNVTGEKRIYGVMGGFHLKHNNKQTKQTIDFFEQLKPQVVLPSHCVDLPALSAFYNVFKGEQIRAGNRYTFEDEK